MSMMLSVYPAIGGITGKKDNGKQAMPETDRLYQRQAPSTNTIGRFETDILTQRENNITLKLTCRCLAGHRLYKTKNLMRSTETKIAAQPLRSG